MITSRSREEVKMAAQKGEINIKSLTHYDICKALESGKSVFEVSEEFRLSEKQIKRIKSCKC